MSNGIRGRLATGRRKVSAKSATPKFGSDAPEVIVGVIEEPLPRRAARGTITLLILGGLSAVLFYLAVAASVAAVLRAGDANAVVLRGAFPQGGAPIGTTVYASSAEIAHTPLGRLREAALGLPDGSVVRIAGRPARNVSNAPDGAILEEGQPTGFSGKIKPRLLVRSYLAICVSGGCGSPGDPVLVPQQNVVGGVKAYVGLDGFSRPKDLR